MADTSADAGTAVDVEGWTRRRDLEGGKQYLIWLEEEGPRELYVEDLTYRDGGHVVYLYDAADDAWETVGEFDGATAATDRAVAWLRERGRSR